MVFFKQMITNSEIIPLDQMKLAIGCGAYLLSIPFIIWPLNKNRPINPKRILLKRLCRQQSLREISPAEFEGLVEGVGEIQSNIMTLVFGQPISIQHLRKICVAELQNAGYAISSQHFDEDQNVFRCSLRKNNKRYYLSVNLGTHHPNSYAFWFDPISSSSK